LLLLVGASRWAVAAVRPEADSTLASQTIGCAWATLLSLALLALQPKQDAAQPAPSRATRLRWLLAGAMFFGGPAIALLVHGRDLDSCALTIALALTPVIIAIASSALGTESSEGIAGRIWPGLAAVAGLLLVLVQPTLGDLRTDLALGLAPTLTGIGAVLFCMDQPSSASRSPTALLGASALFAIALAGSFVAVHTRPSLSLLAVACDGIMALLGILTLNQLGATRWSSQFTWVPLLVILEGIVLVRPQLTAHWFIGLILLILAGVYLLLPQVDESRSGTSPVPTLPG
jgi:drug/metabolite transporter (DMT)-like permease